MRRFDHLLDCYSSGCTVELMPASLPAWQELLFLNYHERLRSAVTEADIVEALEAALDDTARDIARRSCAGPGDTSLEEAAIRRLQRRPR